GGLAVARAGRRALRRGRRLLPRRRAQARRPHLPPRPRGPRGGRRSGRLSRRSPGQRRGRRSAGHARHRGRRGPPGRLRPPGRAVGRAGRRLNARRTIPLKAGSFPPDGENLPVARGRGETVGRARSLMLLAAVVGGLLAAPVAGHAATTIEGVPRYDHVFTIVLENENYDATWNTPAAGGGPTYLQSLRSQGVFADHYYGISHVSADNYIAMTSGQPATPLFNTD